MKLIHNIKNGIFIIQNVFSEELINEIIDELKLNIDNEDFKVRMSYTDEYDKSFDIKQYYKECDDNVLEIFNKFDSTGVLQKYSECKTSNELDKKILPHYRKALKFIYNQYEEFKFNHHGNDLFKYSPGNFMNKHTDNVSKRRLCTTVLYLNDMKDNFIGGEVIFYENELLDSEEIFRYRPNKGDLIIMDSSEKTNYIGIAHSVNRIENWDRYVNRIYWNNIKFII